MPTDAVAHLTEVDLLRALRRIVDRADQRGEEATATRAGELLAVFAACRVGGQVPAWLRAHACAFVRQHPH
jgi:hypothetical protein